MAVEIAVVPCGQPFMNNRMFLCSRVLYASTSLVYSNTSELVHVKIKVTYVFLKKNISFRASLQVPDQIKKIINSLSWPSEK